MKGIGPKLISIAMFIPLLVVLVVGWSKVPPPEPENLETIVGTFDEMNSPCCGKWVISLKEDNFRYEVKKDLVKAFLLKEMEETIRRGDTLRLQIFKLRVSPFNPGGKNRPVATIEGNGQTFLSLKDTQEIRMKGP